MDIPNYTITLEAARKELGYSEVSNMYPLLHRLNVKRQRVGKKAYITPEDLERMKEYRSGHTERAAKSPAGRKETSPKKKTPHERHVPVKGEVHTFNYLVHDGQMYVSLQDLPEFENLVAALKVLKKD